jgi:hypothetical protein
MRSKTICTVAGSALVAMLIASGSAYASNEVIKNPPASNTVDVGMQEFARQLGIDPTGKTNGELKIAIKENSFNVKNNRNVPDGKKHLTPEQQNQSLVDLAQRWGINTADLTNELIEQAVQAEKLIRS